MSFKKLFLPLGLIVAFTAGLAYPPPGIAFKSLGLVPYLVGTIFLINGYSTKTEELPRDHSFLLTLIFGGIVALLVGPFIGLGVGKTLAIEAVFATGLIVMSAMPPTLSSGIIIVDSAEGNNAWAIIMTVSLSFIAILTIPFMLSLTLAIGGEATISPGLLMRKLALMVLLPFTVGFAAKKIIKKNTPTPVKYIPTLCIIFIVWGAVSASARQLADMPLRDFAMIIPAVLLVHLILLGINYTGGRYLLKLKQPENRALFFVCSQKTLPVALSVLTALSLVSPQTLIICICFHFLQIIFDSSLAARLPVIAYQTAPE
jgi:solute carrier family 10 (sodium/bile acid cotransporter), member 7